MIRAALVALAAGIVAAGFFSSRTPSPAGMAQRDFEAYYAGGAAWRFGGDPYGRDVWRTEKKLPGVRASRDELLPFVGPAFGLPLWSALSRLPWDAAVAVWRGILGLAFVIIALGSLRLAGGTIRTLDVVATLIVAAGFGPLTSGFALGQTALVATAGIVLAALALQGEHAAQRGGIALALPAALVAALQPNLAVALIARLSDVRSWIAFVGAGLIALGGTALALGGPGGIGRYLGILRAHDAAERFSAIQTTPEAVARALGMPAHAAGLVALACAVSAIVAIALVWRSGCCAPDGRLALACAALPLALPFAHAHDFAIVFLPAIAVTRRARGVAWVCAATAALLAGTDWLGIAQRPAAAEQTLLLTLAAALGLAVLARGPLRLHHALPMLTAFAVLAASFVATGHRLPIWPDALGLGFHVPATMAAPDVWRLEQVRSGITHLDPVWGVLRLVSLAGCALLSLTAGFVLLRVPSSCATSATALNSEPSSTPPRRPAEACPFG